MSYFRARNLLLVFALVLAAGLAVTITLRVQPEAVIKTAVESLPEGVDLALKDIDYTHVQEGIARWRLKAEQVEHQSSDKLLLVRKPHLDFYDEEGELQGTLVAEAGQVTSAYDHVVVNGEVVLESVHGYTFFTKTLEYDHKRQRVTTDDPVKLLGEGVMVTGKGLNLNLVTRKLIIRADVDALFEPNRINQD